MGKGEMGDGVTVPVGGEVCKNVRGEWHRVNGRIGNGVTTSLPVGRAGERRVSARRVFVKEVVVARRVVASRSSETSQRTQALLQSSVNPALTNPLGILQLL